VYHVNTATRSCPARVTPVSLVTCLHRAWNPIYQVLLHRSPWTAKHRVDFSHHTKSETFISAGRKRRRSLDGRRDVVKSGYQSGHFIQRRVIINRSRLRLRYESTIIMPMFIHRLNRGHMCNLLHAINCTCNHGFR